VNIRLLGTDQADDWRRMLELIPTVDIYFLPEYHRAHELNGDGSALAFVAQEQDSVLFYPFFKRPIPQSECSNPNSSLYDIETVYGYSGPLCKSHDAGFLPRAWAAFADWCRDQQIIAEFIRFHPLLQNHRNVDDTCQVKLQRETVAVRLNCSESDLWNGYPAVQRNMVRKAVNNDLVCEEAATDETLGAFKNIYRQTMDRIEAGRYYHFSEIYFEHLCESLGEKVKLFVVRDDNQIVAAALFLQHGDTIHYHLSGADERYREASPTNLLLHTVAQWGQRHSLRWLHLGGGRTSDPNDGLLRFKSSISKLRTPFYVGNRVHDDAAYTRLCSEWMQKRDISTPPEYFLLYRL
jgi:hypothetical protein